MHMLYRARLHDFSGKVQEIQGKNSPMYSWARMLGEITSQNQRLKRLYHHHLRKCAGRLHHRCRQDPVDFFSINQAVFINCFQGPTVYTCKKTAIHKVKLWYDDILTLYSWIKYWWMLAVIRYQGTYPEVGTFHSNSQNSYMGAYMGVVSCPGYYGSMYTGCSHIE